VICDLRRADPGACSPDSASSEGPGTSEGVSHGGRQRNQGRPVGADDPARVVGYTMYTDEQATPPTLVCQVGSTTLKYDLRAIQDLHAWLVEQGDWVDLGAADEKKPAKDGTVEGFGPVGVQSGRRLVRAPQRLPRPVRDVHATTARGARAGRAHPRSAQQQDAGHLSPRPTAGSLRSLREFPG